jgi:deoxyribonuclease IV
LQIAFPQRYGYTPLVFAQLLCYRDSMAILGAHQSIAGGYDKAVFRARQCGADCVQLFTKNNTQWSSKSITPEAARRFREALDTWRVTNPQAHDSYLINLASPDRQLWRKSVNSFVEELHGAEILGIPYVVTHPGAFTTATEKTGLRNVSRALDEVADRTADLKARCLLETTAGQGTALGWRFEHFAAILDRLKRPDRVGFCFVTCHVFAAGYPLVTPEEYEATMAEFDRLIGIDRIKSFHLNDSRRELGSRVDRHEHIGRGHLGIEAFRHLLADTRFRNVPMYLETPKGEEDGEDLDAINLRVLRGCIKT